MPRVEVIRFEYEHCGECPNVLDWYDTGKKGYRCNKGKRRRIVPDLWGEIPSWCPLEVKK